MANIDNLEIQITANADSAASAINRLSSGCDRLHTSASSAASGTRELAAGAEKAGTATHKAGAETGSAEPAVRRFGRSAEEAGKNAKKGTAGISDFWKALKRVTYYRIIRSIIKEITQAFKEGITNLYHWSDIMGGHFAKNMDRLATSTQYLKNGLGTLVAPLIEAVIPAIETLIDLFVEGINYVNMFFAAIGGKSTYTAAKKVAAVWDDATTKTAKNAKKTADEMKRTILAFDEINKLTKPNSSSGSGGSSYGKKQPNYAGMFEERPITGFLKKVSDITKGLPDWVKWLLGGTALVGGFLLIKKFIPWLLKKLGQLFAMKIPEWLKWLFGPKGDGNNGTNIPDKIKMPDTTLPVQIDPSPDAIVDKFTDLWKSKDRSLPFSGYITSGPFVVFNKFLSIWDAANKALPMTAYISTPALALYKLFLERWEATNKVLPFSAYITTTALALYNLFNDRWEASNKALAFTGYISTSAESMYKIMNDRWEASNKALAFTAYISTTARTLYNRFKESWYEHMRKLPINVSLVPSADALYHQFLNAWNRADRYVTVRVRYISGDTTKQDNGLGAASGGSNVGKIGGKVSEGLKVKFAEPDKKDVIDLWSVLKKLWNGYTYLYKKELDFAIDVTADLVTGKGLVGQTDIASWALDPLVQRSIKKRPLIVPVDAKTAWGKTVSSVMNYLGLSSLSTNISAYLKQTWGRGANGAINSLGLGNLWTTIAVYLEPKTKEIKVASGGGGTWRLYTKANGGVLYNGAWSDIPQYAGGTYNAMHGSLFWAGERGAEVVGHANGRTEVLNRSQIASAIYSAVNAAMAPASANFAAAASNMANTEAGYDMDGLADMVRQGVEGALERQREILRQQTEYLRQINDKEFKAEVTTASINSAQTRFNRRAGVTVVPVG